MIQAKEIKLVSIDDIVVNPKNPNKHPKEQIDRLKKIIKEQGFRSPLVVSNRSGLLIVGHGRLEAARALKLKKLPVIFQDFKDEAQEYAHMTADNALQSWSELDFSNINLQIGDFGPDFDLDLLGLKDFRVDVADFAEPAEKGEPKDKETSMVTCPNCGVLYSHGA